MFTPVKYRADGGFHLIGLPLLFGSLVIASGGIGWLASFLGQWLHYPIFFQIGLALMVAGCTRLLCKWMHLRNMGVAVLAGLVAGVVTVTAMHYFDYLRALDDPRVKLAITQDPAVGLSFGEFLHAQATAGVKFVRSNLGFYGTWIYWVVEGLFVVALAIGAARMHAVGSYCAKCQKWKDWRQLGTFTGSPDAVRRWVEKGDILRLTTCEPQRTGGSTVICVAVCPTGRGDCDITVGVLFDTIDEDGRPKRNPLGEALTYPGEALTEFETLFANADATPQQVPVAKPWKQKAGNDSMETASDEVHDKRD